MSTTNPTTEPSRPHLADGTPVTEREEARFWTKVTRGHPSECWLWTGRLSGGYGRFSVGGRIRKATHVALALAGTAVASGQLACHHCDTPACCNPAHLYAGNPQSNVDDMVRRGRHRTPLRLRGDENPSAKLSASDVVAIRTEHATGTTQERLAVRFGVTQATISKIVTHRSHRYTEGLGVPRGWRLGHVLDVLPSLPDGCAHACVTSPPYFGLRDYGTDPQGWPEVTFAPMPGLPPMTIPAMRASLGNEPDLWAYVGHLVLVFREVRRVLRDDGTLWLNLGDSSNSAGGPRTTKGPRLVGTAQHERGTVEHGRRGVASLKPKDLLGVPWRVALALQADGWYLRSDIVWHKPAVLPESVTDRPTRAHEYVFLLSKSRSYFYDADAVAEPVATADQGPAAPADTAATTRNRRSVWTIATQPYSGAHFATMPPALAEVAILAGTSAGGCCATCGRPWDWATENEGKLRGGRRAHRPMGERAGWCSMCHHGGEPVPCRVIDPFGGAGTTALVAHRKGRHFDHIELNPAYLDIARTRFEADAPLLNRSA